ncbi:helix-turn-helix domain-containing protein [Actinomadura oligospora]|uniref:helix-turn-helix domain-containing protein n=1 Tax=Actinomadura oligospora TaxID=111804 RepID=UPI0004B08D35|nr:helix-turn-helix domain-containing protein [Actinomadura oligospora]
MTADGLVRAGGTVAGGPVEASGTVAGGLIEAVEDMSGAAAAGIAHLPDTATSLVFRSAADGREDLLVVGPRTRAAYFTGKELPLCVHARLRPGVARSALGAPISELLDRVVPLTEFWGADASRLERRLGDLGGDPRLIARRLETALRSKAGAREHGGARRGDDDGRLVHAAARELASARPARLPDLAHRLSVSERRLRDLFTDGAGLPPKAFARIARLNTAVTAGAGGLAELAAASGYYDQAHMSAEFRSLLGVPPGAFFAGRLPAPRTC